jgi:anti-anti-sigma regulatory factor
MRSAPRPVTTTAPLHPLTTTAPRTGEVRPGIPLVVAAAGALRGPAVPQLGAALDRALDRRPWGVVLDLTGVAAVPLVALAMLCRVAQRAGRLDVGLALVASPAVRAAVEQAGLSELFELHAGLADALVVLRVRP